MIYVKIHKGEREVVAICDESLINKEFKEGRVCLKVTESFYKGEKKSKEEVEKIMLSYDNLNIVGEESIKIALDLKIIDEDCIIRVQGVPHAQSISL